MKTEGAIRDRAKNYAQFLYWVLYVGLVVFALLLIFQTDFLKVHPISTLAILVVIVLLTVLAHVSVFKGKEINSFIYSGLTLVALVALLFSGLFPRLMISSISAKYNLVISTASSTPYTLKIMTIATFCLLPFILAYTIWAYYIFRRRIKMPTITEGE